MGMMPMGNFTPMMPQQGQQQQQQQDMSSKSKGGKNKKGGNSTSNNSARQHGNNNWTPNGVGNNSNYGGNNAMGYSFHMGGPQPPQPPGQPQGQGILTLDGNLHDGSSGNRPARQNSSHSGDFNNRGGMGGGNSSIR